MKEKLEDNEAIITFKLKVNFKKFDWNAFFIPFFQSGLDMSNIRFTSLDDDKIELNKERKEQ